MKRGDGFFATVGNSFCFSGHFSPTDFKRTLTGHRRDLKRTIVLSLDKMDEGCFVEQKG